MTLLGWLSDPFQWLSDLQLGDEKVTLNHLVGNKSRSLSIGIPTCVACLLARSTTFLRADLTGSSLEFQGGAEGNDATFSRWLGKPEMVGLGCKDFFYKSPRMVILNF